MNEIKEKNYKKTLKTIIIVGILMRIVFVLCSRVYYLQYDFEINEIKNPIDYEKLYTDNPENTDAFERYFGYDYVRTIYKTGKLPNEPTQQFYHPPLNFALLAGWLKIMDYTPFSASIKIESMRLLPCLYSIISIFFLKKLLDEMGLSDKSKLFTMSFYLFTPLFVLMSGLLNGDMLVTMFMIIALYYLVRWKKSPNYKDALILGLMIGLGTNAKTSMAVIGVITAVIFVKKFVDLIIDGKKENKELLIKIVLSTIILCIIAFPLMLWYQVRNYNLFGQPMFYVVPGNEKLYNGNHSNFEKFNLFSKEILSNELGDNDCNVFSYVIKSIFIFGYKFDTDVVTIGKILIVLFVFFSIYAEIYMYARKDEKYKDNAFFNFIVILLWMISFLAFNITLPYSCTMHSRYIVVAFLFLAIQISCYYDYRDNISNEKDGEESIIKLINIWNLFYMVSVLSMYFIIIINLLKK